MDPTVIICIDGLGKDLISLENTPFLYEFGKNNLISRLETLFAFTGIEYCFFSGKEPDKTKIWLEFEKSKRSIFNNPLIRLFSFNKKLRTYLGAFIQLFSNRTYIAGLHNIPKNMLKYFDTSSKKGLWEKEYFKDKNFVFYKWPFFIQKDENKLTKRLVFKYEKDNERLKRLTLLLELEVKKPEPSNRNIVELNREIREDSRDLLKLQNLYEERYTVEIDASESIKDILKALGSENKPKR